MFTLWSTCTVDSVVNVVPLNLLNLFIRSTYYVLVARYFYGGSFHRRVEYTQKCTNRRTGGVNHQTTNPYILEWSWNWRHHGYCNSIFWLFNIDSKLLLFYGTVLGWENELGWITKSDWFGLFSHAGFKTITYGAQYWQVYKLFLGRIRINSIQGPNPITFVGIMYVYT